MLGVAAPGGPAVGGGIVGLEADKRAVGGTGVQVAAGQGRLESDWNSGGIEESHFAGVLIEGDQMAAGAARVKLGAGQSRGAEELDLIEIPLPVASACQASEPSAARMQLKWLACELRIWPRA